MTRKLIFGSCLLAAAVLVAQDATVTEIPSLQGVYYRSANEWVALPFTILTPNLKSSWKWWLGTGQREFAGEVPGEHAATSVGTTPVFVIRGMPSRITPIVIRFNEKNEFRSVPMPLGKLREPRTTFPEESRVPIEVRVVGDQMVAIRPQSALAPGEYAVLASPNANATLQFLSYDFRVAP